jgi:hypothetical protein
LHIFQSGVGEGWAKRLFDKVLVPALARVALAICALRVGFIRSAHDFQFRLLLRRGEKNKINLASPNSTSFRFHQIALSCQKAKPLLILIYHYRIWLLVCLFTLVASSTILLFKATMKLKFSKTSL